LGLVHDLVRHIGNFAVDDLAVEEAQGFLVASLAEEALAVSEHDRVDLQPKLVDKIVL
jgi:hypothetical protein